MASAASVERGAPAEGGGPPLPYPRTEALAAHLAGEGCTLHLRATPARAPRHAEPAAPLPPLLSAALAAAGVARLYAHQAAALDALAAGRDVLCSTGTGSGKSLVFLLPALAALLAQPQRACALLLFPTKALLHDQLLALQELVAGEPALAAAVRARVLSGDTPHGERARVRDEATLLFCTLDIVSAHLLPEHASGWGRLLRGLALVVIDEAHVYRGVFGAGAALVLARLRRLCAHYRGCGGDASSEEAGSSSSSSSGSAGAGAGAPAPSTFRVIACSATVSNPEVLFRSLAGAPEVGLAVIDHAQDGSPSGAKTLVVWQPPLLLPQGAAAGEERAPPTSAPRGAKRARPGSAAAAAAPPAAAAELQRLLWENRLRRAAGAAAWGEGGEGGGEEEGGEAALAPQSMSCLEASTLALASTVSPALAAYLRGDPRAHSRDAFGAILIPYYPPPERAAAEAAAAAATAAPLHWREPPRRSSFEEAARLTVLLLGLGKSVIVFGRTRKVVDLLSERIQGKLAAAAAAEGGAPGSSAQQQQQQQPLLPPPSAVVSYRAGFTPEVRRGTEQALRAGSLRCVVATNALELGLDVGCLDCAVLMGHPGSSSSLWQQVGRAGRGARAGAAFLVLTAQPLCRALARAPAELLSRAPEAAVIPYSSHAAREHVLAGAAELPLSQGELAAGRGARVWGGAVPAALLQALREEGALVPEAAPQRSRGSSGAAASAGSLGGAGSFVSRGWVPSRAAASAAPLVLRGLGGGRDYSLVLAGGGAGGQQQVVVETMEEARVRVECVPPPFAGCAATAQHRAIITSRGQRFSVEAVCHQQRLVTLYRVPPREATYYTLPLAYTRVDVTAAPVQRAGAGGGGGGGGVAASRCLVKVCTTVQGLQAVEARSGQSRRVDSLRPASYTSQAATPGVVWTLPLGVLVALAALPCHPLAAIHAAAHALLRVLPQLLLCDAGDLDTEHSPSPLCTAPRPGVLVLYEPVECGLAAAACARAPALVSAARQLLQRCPCPSGCFDCLQSRGCTLSSCKAGAMLVLRSLQAEA